MTTKRQTFSFVSSLIIEIHKTWAQQRRHATRENEEGEKSSSQTLRLWRDPQVAIVVFVLLRVVHASRFEQRKSVTDDDVSI